VPYPAPADIQGWLDYLQRLNSETPPWIDTEIERSATAEQIDLGGVPGFLAEPRQGEVANRILFAIHGGGFVTGGGNHCKFTSTSTAVSLRARTYSVDYRMPPLHPYPAPLDDCWSLTNS
jgi:monoterpene epsilon-lactone hydrolase